MRKWRVGTISMGVLLVATGLLLLLSELQGFNGAAMILRWWPVILIILGLEILAYIFFSQEEQPRIRFDGLSIFLTVIIILISSGVYGLNSFMKSEFSQVFLGEIGYYKNYNVFNKNYEIEAEQVGKLQINNSNGLIQVDKYDGNTIKVDVAVAIKNNDEKEAAELAQDLIEVTEGNTLILSTRSIVLPEDNRNCQATINYAVKVPKELEFAINNSRGDIILRELVGKVKVQGESGRVEADSILGDVEIRNLFGETRVRDIKGRLAVESEHGDIFLSNSRPAQQDITLSSKHSGIRVELPKEQQGQFLAVTQFGEINLDGFGPGLSIEDEAATQDSQDDNNAKQTENEGLKQILRGTIGKASPHINLRTEQGNIELRAI